MDFTIKQNDTLPDLHLQLTDSGGFPFDLRYTAGVRMRMMKRGAQYAKIGRFVTVTDDVGGRIKHVWLAGDTDEVGVFRTEFEATDSLGRIQTYPDDGFYLIEVVDDLTHNLSAV
jgi:5-hydroxyisourate hydrolase-like protein (transthyretin family)